MCLGDVRGCDHPLAGHHRGPGAIVVGLPLGVVALRFAWDLAASNFGVVFDVVIPSWQPVVIALGALVVVNLIGVPGGHLVPAAPGFAPAHPVTGSYGRQVPR